MKKIIFILLVLIFSTISKLQAQGLQPGECGIMFTYDAAGDLIQREFICNNTGDVIYKTSKDETNKNDSLKISSKSKNGIADGIIKVNAIMPNPTTGRFMVRLSQAIVNGNVLLLDVNGKVMEKRRQSGNMLSFDISTQPAGTYFVRIEVEGKVSTLRLLSNSFDCI